MLSLIIEQFVLRFIRPQRKGIFVEVFKIRPVFVRAHSTKIQVFVVIDRSKIKGKNVITLWSNTNLSILARS